MVALSSAGSSALGGYGSYNLARGIGDVLASRRLDKASIATIEDYLTVSAQESSIRRKSKIVGVASAAVAMIAAPLVGHILSNAHHASTATTQQPLHETNNVPVNSVAHNNITPVDANTYPWTYAMQELHTNISNPAVLSKLVNNPQGIKFQGNGLGGGLGRILSVTENGKILTDNASINLAITKVLG